MQTGNLIDGKLGQVNICGRIAVMGGVSQSGCTSRGIAFERTYEMPSPYAQHGLAPCLVGEHKTTFSFSFKEDRLFQISIYFLDGPDDAKQETRLYGAYLQSLLGDPTTVEMNGLLVSYIFDWGRVDATYDPRNDTSGIFVTWLEFA